MGPDNGLYDVMAGVNTSPRRKWDIGSGWRAKGYGRKGEELGGHSTMASGRKKRAILVVESQLVCTSSGEKLMSSNRV